MKKILLMTLSALFSLSVLAHEKIEIRDVSVLEALSEDYIKTFIPKPDEVIVYKKVPEYVVPPATEKAKQKAKKRSKESQLDMVGKVFEPTLQIFYPDGKKPESPVPCAIFFGGGAWNNVHPTQFLLSSSMLSDMGIVGINATYRTKRTMGKDDITICVEDAKSAVRYVREHAQELGIDPNMIAVGGGSAGGHVAIATFCLDSYDCPEENLEISAKPNLLLLFNPVMDNSEKGYGYAKAKDIFPAISPMHNLKDDMPPSIVFVGDKDPLCKYQMCQKFKDFMDSKNLDCELYIYKGEDHSFFNHFKGKKNYVDTHTKVINFLKKHKYLK